ncbi:MAG: DUF2950 domain-containing protein [bacterium]|nr:DUF2950 domain-containing protein [bacterium]
MRTLPILAAVVLVAGCATHAPSGARTGAPRFSTPKAAVDALLAACGTNDEAKVVAVFGEQARPVVSTGDPVADRERCDKLLAAAKESLRLDPIAPDTVSVVLGADDWAMPIPLVKEGKGWHFDLAAGMAEIRRRRIGANELEAIDACRIYVAAQDEYAKRRIAGGAYAQRLASTPGKRDGLYWASTKGGRDASPLAPVVASLADPSGAWRGYRFRVLAAQGSSAPGGARSYVAGGRMTRGFALVAYPAVYGSTGIMTFVVDAGGRVYQKDLGAQTDAVAAAMTAYDPDPTWTPAGG